MICRAALPGKVVSHQGGDDAIMMMTMMVMMIKMMVMMTCRIVEISDNFCGNHGFSGMTVFLVLTDYFSQHYLYRIFCMMTDHHDHHWLFNYFHCQ